MKNTSKNILKGTLIAGALVGAASLTAAPANMFNYNDLGSGSEVRANLIERALNNSSNLFLELKCGEGKCGEGKCGEENAKKTTDKKTKKAKTKAKSKTKKADKESKTKEGKCGEGKCGEGEKGL